jgi:hypothetical protein
MLFPSAPLCTLAVRRVLRRTRKIPVFRSGQPSRPHACYDKLSIAELA